MGMAVRKWIVLPGGRIKRWKQARADNRAIVPPRWYRNHLNRRDRRLATRAIAHGMDQPYPHIHPHTAGWYW
jgi:hypothetical protein